MSNDQAPASEDPRLAAALAAHKAGELDEASRLYAETLRHDPRSWRAAANFGALSLTLKAFDQAQRLFAQALAIAPERAELWDRYVNALIAGGGFEAAEQAIAARAAGFAEQAAAATLRLRQHWAARLTERRDFAGAEAQLRQLIAATPDDPETYNDLGRLHVAAGQPQAALAAFDRALALAPDHLASLLNRGAVCQMLRRPDEAEAAWRQALAIEPGAAQAAGPLARLLRAQGREAEAAALEAAGPGDLLTRAELLNGAGRHEAAIAAFGQALKAGAGRYRGLVGLGMAQAGLGRQAEALAMFDEAVALQPDEPLATYQRGFVRLATGDLAGGWADYETRLRHAPFLANNIYAPAAVSERLETAPTREDLAGRRVLVIREQGLGDQVMFAGALAELAATASQVVCLADERLRRLFTQSFPQVAFREPRFLTEAAEPAERVMSIGSLGYAFRRRAEDFPGAPYLKPSPDSQARWAERLGPGTGLRIGLSWRGGTALTRAHARSMPLERLASLLDLPGCEFVSLQYGDVRAEVEAVNAGRPRQVRAFEPAEVDDYADLAGLMANLDLVVSVQTSALHLAGALGVPAIGLIPRVAEWRYGAQGDTMPWYGSVRLFRQGEDGDWGPVIARVVDAVKDWS